MCILFFALSPPSVGAKKYRFIIGSNRDEFFARPTQQLCHWECNPDVIGAIDKQPGRGEGTWLGINTADGKFSVLTNYRLSYTEIADEGKRQLLSRGRLVADFLTSSDTSSQYIAKFAENKSSYGKSNLLTGDLSLAKPELFYSTNAETHEVLQLNEGVHSLCNKVLDSPWQKEVNGREQFAKVVAEVSEPEQLIQEVVKVMSDDTTYKHDPTIEDLDWEDELKVKMSSIFVADGGPIPEMGTRTTSVILVEEDGTGWYYEKSLEQPVDPNNLVWRDRMIKFHV